MKIEDKIVLLLVYITFVFFTLTSLILLNRSIIKHNERLNIEIINKKELHLAISQDNNKLLKEVLKELQTKK